MIKFILKRSVKLSDDAIDKLNKSDLRDFDESANNDIFDWVNNNIIPALKLILNDDVIIRNSDNGDIIINSYNPKQVEDSITYLFNKFTNARKHLGRHQIRSYIKDSQSIPLYRYQEDKDTLTSEEFLGNILPKVEEYLQGIGIDYYIKYREDLFAIELPDIEFEELEKIEGDLEHIFSDNNISVSKSHIQDDEISELIDGEVEEVIPLDYESFLNNVIVPAIRAKVAQVEADTDITVTTDGNMIVINTSFDEKSKPMTEEDLEVVEEDFTDEDEQDTISIRDLSSVKKSESEEIRDSKITKVKIFNRIIDSLKSVKFDRRLIFVGTSDGKIVRKCII